MLRTKLIVERLDKEGRLLERREQQSRSFLIQFMKFLQNRHDFAAISIQDITNTSRTLPGTGYDIYNLVIASPGGYGYVGLQNPWNSIQGEQVGIVVGTGVGAVAPTNYALGTKIAHGNGAGQLEYAGNEILPIVIAAPSASFTIRRYFTNNSGGAITVQEVGIYSYMGVSLYTYSACIARDLTGAVAVANTEILRVSYVPQITV